MSVEVEEKCHLQQWAMTHQPAGDLIWKNGYWEQIIFVRDRVAGVLSKGSFEEHRAIGMKMRAVSEHTSKSVRLPVFSIELADGTVFTLRYNFYDWKVSVDSPHDVNVDFMGLFDPAAKISPVYCEGFPTERVFGPYAENKRQFTIELSNNFQLYTFFWIFSRGRRQ